MGIYEDDIDRIISVVRMNCALSGGCIVFKTGTSLTCVIGDEEICFVTQNEGRDAETVRQKITEALK